eukprot:6465488-Amphidinium_carterae.2
MSSGTTQPSGSAGHSLAIEVCHSFRIQNTYYRNQAIWYMDNLFRADSTARKRFNPHQRTSIEGGEVRNLSGETRCVGTERAIDAKKIQWRALIVLVQQHEHCLRYCSVPIWVLLSLWLVRGVISSGIGVDPLDSVQHLISVHSKSNVHAPCSCAAAKTALWPGNPDYKAMNLYSSEDTLS